MDDSTPNLSLPYIMAAQAQKHVTHNEAIRALDALVMLSVLDNELATPPTSPNEGDRYLIPEGATGAWLARVGELAAFQDGAWAFYEPKVGWTAWVVAAGALHVFDGATWSPVADAVSVNPTPLVGINSTADETNRLAVASPASLFSHDGHGHRQKINKSSAAETASTIYQTDFSGRAEIGLSGDDNFHFKVSADGETWQDALVLERTTGTPRVPSFDAASLPSAPDAGAGAIIFVPDAEGGASLAVSDGTSWRLISSPTPRVAAPEFSPEAGDYAAPQSVVISSETDGASIYYTIDGSAPEESDALYEAPIDVEASLTIKAIAIKSGMLDSEIASAAYTITDWHNAYDLASGNPLGILDFVGDRYFWNGSSVALSSLVTNPGAISSSGMALNSTSIVATGALLAAMQGANCSIVAETSGATAGENDAIISMNNSNSYSVLFKLSTNVLRNNNGSVLLNTANTADWTGIVYAGLAFSAAGRSLCLDGGTVAGDSGTIPSRTSIEIGWRATDINLFGGHMRRLIVWSRRLSDADLQEVTQAPPWS